jgi:hypothetical protein
VIEMATMTPAELATELGTDARTTRKFLRSITPRDAQPGKGSRWSIEKKQLRSLRTKFAAVEKALAEAKALRVARSGKWSLEASDGRMRRLRPGVDIQLSPSSTPPQLDMLVRNKHCY